MIDNEVIKREGLQLVYRQIDKQTVRKQFTYITVTQILNKLNVKGTSMTFSFTSCTYLLSQAFLNFPVNSFPVYHVIFKDVANFLKATYLEFAEFVLQLGQKRFLPD